MNKHSSTVGPIGFSRIRSLLAFRHQSPLGRLMSVVAAFTAALLLVGANVMPAQAAPSPCPLPGGFEIDGDMTAATCDPPGDDWGAHTLTPAGDVDATTQVGTYSTAGKDDDNPSTWVTGGGTPDKTDFERAYATSKTVDIGGGVLHYFVYVAWERSSTTGTQGYAIEVNNTAANTAADGTPQPDRSQGTTVVYISSQGAKPPKFDEACTFMNQSDYGDDCSTDPNPYVTFAINTDAITDPLNSGTSQAGGSFFEVALDVTGLTGIKPSCPGATDNSVYLRSITGQTHNGNLKGYIAPLTVAPDSTCVTPTITTQTQQNPLIDGLNVVAPGTNQQDVATVTGSGAHLAPTGSVAFWLCGPTGSPADCTTGGIAGGTNPLQQNATNSTATSDAVPAPSEPGWYCWRAKFTPDPVSSTNPFLSATATDKANECFLVAHASPSISTESSATTSGGAATRSVGFTELGDTATLSGAVSGAVPTNQHVTFTLYGPGGANCTDVVYGPVSAPLSALDSTTWQATAPPYTPTAADGPGDYTWIASYDGDEINDGDTGACDDPNETQTLVGPLLTLDKGTPQPTINAGDDAVYDIDLANVGAGTASGVVVTDVLPILDGGGTWTLDGTSGYDCSIADGTGPNAGHQVVTCDVGDLNPSPTPTTIAEVSATTTADDCGVLNNQASVAADPEFTDSTDIIAITVQCPGLHLVKTPDDESVDAGSPIGFTITASNTGAGSASGVLVHDVLPTGVTWAIDQDQTTALTCDITAGVLDCTGTLPAGGPAESVHVTAPTTFSDCGVYDNHATLTAANAPAPAPADASTSVLCSHLALTKTADAGTVFAGGQIGFTVTASNGAGEGVGTAHGVVINDPLPGGSGVDWSIASGPGTCTVQGSPSSETLHCSAVDLAPGASEAVHLVSQTTSASCQAYPNVATLTAGNAPTLTATATATVTNCIIVSPPVQQHHPHVLPNTGGPNGWLFAGGMGMLLAGASLVLTDQRRGRRS